MYISIETDCDISVSHICAVVALKRSYDRMKGSVSHLEGQKTDLITYTGNPAGILYKSIAGRYRPVSYPDGPITARYRFIKNASWELTQISLYIRAV